MPVTYQQKKRRHNNVAYIIIAALLICAIFLSVINYLHTDAEENAYETLHVQTKQIKDDLTLQIKSDKENLITMANFASKLYARGEGYDIMFDSFNPIGLFSRIGILTPDCTFITKDETHDLSSKMSFSEEVLKDEHITGRTESYSKPGEEVVRVGVPIKVNNETVGMIYGIIKIESINKKYNTMAEELDAQLFVYDKESGKYIIDSFSKTPGEISELKNRKFNKGFSYEQLVSTDKGFSSFKSIRTGEDLYVHYSTIEDFNWGIILARYETQVLEKVHKTSVILFTSFAMMVTIIILYLFFVLKSEKIRSNATSEASGIRKLLLEFNQHGGNVYESLKKIQIFSHSRSAFFADTDGEDYNYTVPSFKGHAFTSDERKYFISELFKYAADLHILQHSTINFMHIIPNSHLSKTNPEFYAFLEENRIRDISVASITNSNNLVSILGTINSSKSISARMLLEDIAVCFSIAVYNKKHLNKTELAATTDSLTGVLNRVSYKKDIIELDEEKPEDFSCIYIDVNELHLRNNKYGHAAGDEMLIFIANTLKEVFFGHSIYRMGGDEFLVFTKNLSIETIKQNVEIFIEQLKTKGYNVAIGTSFRSHNTNCEEMVREAEIRMYESKAQYYQNKENQSVSSDTDTNYVQTKTGIREIDTMISVLKEHYNGIYRVSLDEDSAHRILMPSYLGYNENEENFSKLLSKYIDEIIHPDFHRAVVSFLNYDAIKRQIAEGNIPKIHYKKTNGEQVVLSVYKLNESQEPANDTLWVFGKE